MMILQKQIVPESQRGVRDADWGSLAYPLKTQEWRGGYKGAAPGKGDRINQFRSVEAGCEGCGGAVVSYEAGV